MAYAGADYDLAVACFLLARVMKTVGASEPALPLLDEARQRFGAITRGPDDNAAERMASVCITERGDCLLHLGRLDEAAVAYEEGIRYAEQQGDDRQVAAVRGQLGSVRLHQGRYSEALAAYAQAREHFARLNEPGSVAVVWHQIGIAYEQAGQPEAAEDAFRRSLAIEVRLGNTAGQARALLQMGNLHDDILNRPEEAAAFYRQAADLYVKIGDAAKEGVARNNLGDTLRRLRRFDEARQEIERAIECKAQFGHAAEPWKTWAILADIETDASNSTAATDARTRAVNAYLAYRRDGGENHDGPGRIVLAVTQGLLADDPPATLSLLQKIADDPELPNWVNPFIRALQAIASGSRDLTLADSPDLDHTMAAEVLLLIDTLQQAGR